MFKITSVCVFLILLAFGHSIPIHDGLRPIELETFEETNRNTILNERDGYNVKARLNVLARESELGGQFEQRRMRRDERLESGEAVRRPDSEYQAFLGFDVILPDNWRSLYSPSGLRKLSPCSSKK